MLQIYLLGKFSVQRDNQLCHVLEARKLQEILGYLLLHAGRPHSREVLASLFWSESTTAQSKKNLRQALWQIQSALEALRAEGEHPLLVVDKVWVKLQIHDSLWVDCIELEKAYLSYRDRGAREISAASFTTLRAATGLYSADLLEGCYQDWCLFERERLQNIYLELLGQLIEYCETHREYEAGIEYGKQVLRYDWTHEVTHRKLMQLYHRNGDRTASLHQYKRCCEALRKEFGASPSRLTTELYHRIQADGLEISRASPSPAKQGSVPAPEEGQQIQDAVRRLNQLLSMLGKLQAETHEQVRVIENALKGRSADGSG